MSSHTLERSEEEGSHYVKCMKIISLTHKWWGQYDALLTGYILSFQGIFLHMTT